MAQVDDLSLLEFQRKFLDETACEAYLFQKRWPAGFVCPHCGHQEYYFIQTRKHYECKCCRYQASLTAGTAMHKSNLPLRIWFWAIYLVVHDKRGRSALSLAGILQLNYRTAWRLLHKIRHAMKERDANYNLSGMIEMDDAYFGSPVTGTDGRGTTKTKVSVALQTDPKGHPLYVRLNVLEAMTSKEIQRVAEQCITPGSSILSDGLAAYRKLNGSYTHSAKAYYREGEDFLKWVHVVISNAKAFILGTYHGLGQGYLQAYLDEFCYRFNRRFSPKQLFARLLNACISASHVIIT
jgi:transposase-like protein